MTLDEFKAWKDGYTEARRGKLTEKDYAKILSKMDEVQPASCGCWHYHYISTPTWTNQTIGAPIDITPTITYGNGSGDDVTYRAVQ